MLIREGVELYGIQAEGNFLLSFGIEQALENLDQFDHLIKVTIDNTWSTSTTFFRVYFKY